MRIIDTLAMSRIVLALQADVVRVKGGAGRGYDGHGEQLVHVHDLERVTDLGELSRQVTQAQVLAVARAIACGRDDADSAVAVQDAFAVVGQDGSVAALNETLAALVSVLSSTARVHMMASGPFSRAAR